MPAILFLAIVLIRFLETGGKCLHCYIPGSGPEVAHGEGQAHAVTDGKR